MSQNYFQLWVGPKMPIHVRECIKSLQKYGPNDHVLVIDNEENIIEGCRCVMIQDLFAKDPIMEKAYNILKTKAKMASVCDYLRLKIQVIMDLRGYSYVDADTLFIRSPHETYTPHEKQVRVYSPRLDYCEINMWTSPSNNQEFMSMMLKEIETHALSLEHGGKFPNYSYYQDVFSRFLTDDYPQFLDMCQHVEVSKPISYHAFEKYIIDRKELTERQTAKVWSKHCVCIHMYRPIRMKREDATRLDVLVYELIRDYQDTDPRY
ncbi:hypothetical protein [Escherichia phage EP_H11]|nr:hypothetical protein [Escherichia phage EP_H11]